MRNPLLKNYIQIAILIVSVSLTSCLRTATPDDDLASGILLGEIAAVQQALDRGANVTRVYQDGSTPLMSACRELKKYHGEAGADVTVAVKASTLIKREPPLLTKTEPPIPACFF